MSTTVTHRAPDGMTARGANAFRRPDRLCDCAERGGRHRRLGQPAHPTAQKPGPQPGRASGGRASNSGGESERVPHRVHRQLVPLVVRPVEYVDPGDRRTPTESNHDTRAGTPVRCDPVHLSRLANRRDGRLCQHRLGETHAADLVVLNVATSNLFGMSGLSAQATSDQIVAAEPSWTKALTESLRSADAALRKDGIKLVIVTTPLPENLSPTESLWNRLLAHDGQTSASYQIGAAMNRAVEQSGVAFLDGWSVFDAESRSAQHSALFGTQDIHFSPHGRAVLANALATYLEQHATLAQVTSREGRLKASYSNG